LNIPNNAIVKYGILIVAAVALLSSCYFFILFLLNPPNPIAENGFILLKETVLKDDGATVEVPLHPRNKTKLVLSGTIQCQIDGAVWDAMYKWDSDVSVRLPLVFVDASKSVFRVDSAYHGVEDFFESTNDLCVTQPHHYCFQSTHQTQLDYQKLKLVYRQRNMVKTYALYNILRRDLQYLLTGGLTIQIYQEVPARLIDAFPYYGLVSFGVLMLTGGLYGWLRRKRL